MFLPLKKDNLVVNPYLFISVSVCVFMFAGDKLFHNKSNHILFSFREHAKEF
jgi:hypothetical protein